MTRITWWAVAAHAIVAGLIVRTAAEIAGLAVALPVGVLVCAGFAFREVWTASRRHGVDLNGGLLIVVEGERGWSRWNLLLQALSPVPVVALVLAWCWGAG